VIYIPGQFRDECDKVIVVYQKLMSLIRSGDLDAADIYIATVHEIEGRRIYEAVLAMVDASLGIPTKDAHG
jgi:hypothetical protein